MYVMVTVLRCILIESDVFSWWCFFLKASEKSIEKKVIAEACKKGLQAFHWRDYWQIPVLALCLEEINIHLAKRKKKKRSYGYNSDVWYSAWSVESCKLHNQKHKLHNQKRGFLLEGSIKYKDLVRIYKNLVQFLVI